MMAGSSSSSPSIPKEDHVKRKRSSARPDLLSSLPDLLICRIFSFLPIRDIVRTSILSRHWRFKWKLTQAISFTFPDCYYDFKFDSFCPWFDRVLDSLTTSTLQKFHLMNYPYHRYSSHKVDPWTQFAILHHAEDLVISLCSLRDCELMIGHYSLPNTLFGCQSLVNLQVSYCDFHLLHNDSCVVNWSSLKVLRIEEAKIDDQVIDKVLEGSPMLEYLELSDCCGMNHVKIYSRKMRELVLDGYVSRDHWGEEVNEFEGEDDYDYDYDYDFDYDNDYDNDKDDPVLEISAPHLHSLRILGFWGRKSMIKLNDVSSLVKVELNFDLRTPETYEDDVRDMMEELLDRLGHINELMIGSLSLQVLHFIQKKAKLSELPKCQFLTLSTGFDELERPGIVEVLKCTPNLERLVMKLGFIEPEHWKLSWKLHFKLRGEVGFNEEYFWISQARGLKCLANHLKTIRISGFPADLHLETKQQLSVIKLLLRYSLVLEHMIIDVVIPNAAVYQQKPVGGVPMFEPPEVAQQILRYQRGSEACKVSVNILPSGVNPS